MSSRRSILVLSIALAIIVYAVLLVLAPLIEVIQPGNEMLPRELRREVHANRMRVSMTKVAPERKASQRTTPDMDTPLRELLRPETDAPGAGEDITPKTTPTQNLDERLGADPLEREHELTSDPERLARADARILEIEERLARRDVEVPRRLVRSGPAEVLPNNVLPVLSGEFRLSDATLGSALSGGAGLGTTAPTIPEPKDEELPDIGSPLVDEQSDGDDVKHVLPQLTTERIMARDTVVNEAIGERPYEFLDEHVAVNLDVYADGVTGDKGFFRIRITPKDVGEIPVLPKDITFVIDSSKSISQHKLDETVGGVKDVLEQLRPEDRFNIVLFRDSATQFRPDLVNATPETIQEAQRFLTDVDSRGETDVYSAISPVIEQHPRPGIPSMVVLLTDGRPTTGMRNARDIINALTEHNVERNTIYAFAGGKTVNKYLLDLLAYRNKGTANTVERIQDIESGLAGFYQEFSSPVLVNLKADYGRINDAEVFPKEIPDFSERRPVTIYGRFAATKDKTFAVRIVGQAGHKSKEIILRGDLRNAQKGDENIARGWAFQKIYYLIAEISRRGEQPELLAEIRRLGRQYNIQTSYDE